MNFRGFFPLLTVLLLTGCFFRPPSAPAPAEPERPVSAVGSTRNGSSAPSSRVSEPPRGPIRLSEAMARAVRRRLSIREARMARVLSDPPLGGVRYERLPEIAREAGYGEFRGRAFEPDDAVDRSAELAELWEVLDLGLGRAAFGGRDRTPPADRVREKSLQTLLADVRYAFYRAAAAQALTRDAEAALRRADGAIRESRDGNADPAAQRALYERMRLLQRATRELAPARAELGLLMNLPPDVAYTLELPRWERPELPSVRSDGAGLDAVALRLRGEVADRLHPERRARDARAGLARMGADGSAGGDGRDWRRAAAQLAVHLFGPAADAENRGRMLDMGVVAQVELALARYRRAERAYRDAATRAESVVDRTSASDGSPEAAGRAIDGQLARVARYLAFGEFQNALARVYNSAGADPLPARPETMQIPELARVLERSMDRRGETLASALAAYGPDRVRPFSAAETGRDPAGEALSGRPADAGPAPRTFPPPVQEPVFPPLGRPEAAPPERERGMERSAREGGRTGAREISVFRDVVSIRRAPAPSAPVVGQGLIGERYPLLGWSPKGWLKIEMNDGSAGWIPTRYVRPVTPERETADVGASGPAPMAVVTTTRANVRFGAGLHFKVRYTEEAGVRVPVVDATGEWFKVRTPDGEPGWLHQSVVRVAGGNG